MSIAFHNDPAIREKYVSRAVKHREADAIVQGYGYWRGGKGCAIGCLAESDDDAHQVLEKDAGLPEHVSQVADAIFEALNPDDKVLWQSWVERYISAPKVGADLSLVWARFAHWMLADETDGLLAIKDLPDDVREAIRLVGELYRNDVAGTPATATEEAEAARAARAAWAARAARDARDARDAGAARAARAARAAWAAWAAGAAGAAGAAWAAFVKKSADKLIELLEQAPVKGA